jgi:hypothetical protein
MRAVFLAFLMLSVVQAQSFSSSQYTVVRDDINVRLDSTVMSDSLGSLSRGDVVEVLGDKYDWYKIVLPKRFTCYIAAELTEEVDADIIRVAADNVNLRKGPSLQSEIVGMAPKDATFLVLEKTGRWIKIRGYPYAWGWVHKKFLQESSPGEAVLSLFVAEVMEQLPGLPMAQRQPLHERLLEKGEEVIPLLESYIPVVDSSTSYSIIAIFSEFGRNDPALVPYFLQKTEGASVRTAALYLDVVQEIVPLGGPKAAYFYLAESGELTNDDIDEVRRLFAGELKTGLLAADDSVESDSE